jgi:hypothetical protein
VVELGRLEGDWAQACEKLFERPLAFGRQHPSALSWPPTEDPAMSVRHRLNQIVRNLTAESYRKCNASDIGSAVARQPLVRGMKRDGHQTNRSSMPVESI